MKIVPNDELMNGTSAHRLLVNLIMLSFSFPWKNNSWKDNRTIVEVGEEQARDMQGNSMWEIPQCVPCIATTAHQLLIMGCPPTRAENVIGTSCCKLFENTG